MLDTAVPHRLHRARARAAPPVTPPAGEVGTAGAWKVAVPPALLMLVLGLWGITREGTLWGDEAVTYDMARRTIPEIWRTLGSADAVHGLYYVLMHGVFAVGEPGLVALRLPSVLAMAATAAGVAVIGRRLAGPRAGLFAGLILPVLPTVQRYAQEGRSYALVCALVTWGTWLLLKRWWTAYAGVMLTACLLHEFAVLLVLAHGVTLWHGGRAPRLPGTGVLGRIPAVVSALPRGWLVAASVVVAGLAPLALFSVTQSQQVDWIGFPSIHELVLVALVAVLARLAFRGPAMAAVRAVALPVLIVPMGLLLLVSLVHPLFVDRYVLSYVVGAALLIGAAADRHWSRALVLATAAAALITLVVHGPHLRSPDSRKNDVGEVAAAVAAIAEPGDGLLFTPTRRRVYTLAHPSAFRGLTDVSLAGTPRASDTLFGAEATPQEIRTRVLGERRIVAVQDLRGQPLDPFPVEAAKRDALREGFRLQEERVVGPVRIGVYIRVPAD
ncbi:hypothetical protein ACIBCM_21560 [Streptomyces sp. NPDC051018]|uniref:hypothetical protein n=1 Tax=Streptomyces sp. NPDC051018 TaxID=3365639 RepID=UPI0037B21BF4